MSRVVLVLCLKLMFHDVEDDGTHNYLVVQPYGANTREYMVAFNADKDVSWKDGCYEVEAECDLNAQALDEPSPDDHASWGYPRIAPICSALRIEGGGFSWREKSK